jgi:hypothetical protein
MSRVKRTRASWNERPCFLWFAKFFASSQATFTG